MARLMVFSGNANPELANEIARTLGIPLGDALVSLFSDGEINIEIRENVRGRCVCSAAYLRTDQQTPHGTGIDD